MESSNAELLKLIKFLHKNILERTNGVRTTITVYNSVDSEYIRQTTDKFNERDKEDKILLNDKKREEILDQRTDNFVADMNDDEFDDVLTKLLEERKARKKNKKVI